MQQKRIRTIFRRIGYTVLVLFVLMNFLAAMHAWRFTHFVTGNGKRYANPQKIGALEAAKVLLTGIPNPRPVNKALPPVPYRTVVLQSNVKLACWYLPADSAARGTVILLHGYGGEKSGMLPKALFFHQQGYHVLLPDFMGTGGSEGTQCTIGFREAENVGTCVKYIRSLGERHLIVLGTSMGAAALLKYLDDGGEQPEGVILECPFGTMYETVCDRFRMVGAPTFPLAGMLVFWGGLENGFWGFSHNPAAYASSVKCPALLVWGAKDDRVSRGETDAIFRNLAGRKALIVYPDAGHNNYFIRYKKEWMNDVLSFIHSLH